MTKQYLNIFNTVSMKNYCNKCNKYRKLKNPKIYVFNETLVVSVICGKCGNNNDTIFKIEESIEILQILGLIYNINE